MKKKLVRSANNLLNSPLNCLTVIITFAWPVWLTLLNKCFLKIFHVHNVQNS